ncbi:MAG: prepilin-type N-terminal cleavage/methylation domain-containing protein [Armatimonadota bacterium]|nr:MAG: prepilin-type N-terminal cleavage/methylation domain-containing protein [Armatimonadota bacterium]
MARSGARSRSRGMTLIELVVVIFIISMLAGIALPAMWQARQRAASTLCVSNMHQVLLGLQMYLIEYEEIPLNIPGKLWWTEALAPYTKSRDVFLCPADYTHGQRYQRGIPCSWFYLYSRSVVTHFDAEGQWLAPESPVCLCRWHESRSQIQIIGRKDGSIEVAPLGKYHTIRAVFE